MSDLKELLERVKNATGPDRGLDCDIMEALGFQVVRKPERRRARGWAYLDAGRWNRNPELTGSIDEVRAFLKRRFPRWHWSMTEHPDGDSLATLSEMGGDHPSFYHVHTHGPVLAMLCTILSALTKENAHGK